VALLAKGALPITATRAPTPGTAQGQTSNRGDALEGESSPPPTPLRGPKNERLKKSMMKMSEKQKEIEIQNSPRLLTQSHSEQKRKQIKTKVESFKSKMAQWQNKGDSRANKWAKGFVVDIDESTAGPSTTCREANTVNNSLLGEKEESVSFTMARTSTNGGFVLDLDEHLPTMGNPILHEKAFSNVEVSQSFTGLNCNY